LGHCGRQRKTCMNKTCTEIEAVGSAFVIAAMRS
jgi:hypothetical protein